MNKSIVRRIRTAAETLVDAMPPYRTVCGTLDVKETSRDGKFYIHVSGSKVEVDEYTCLTLGIGEVLKVRYTRGYKAINIDRYLT